MQCFYPVQDSRVGLRPCGQCAACMVQKHLQWKFRLTQEVLANDLALWLTLQYDDDHLFLIDNRPAVNKVHCQNYFRKLRKYFHKNDLKVIFTYFLVSEYGPLTNRPHYHVLLLFKLPKMEIEPLLILRQKIYEQCKERWYHGHVQAELFHKGVIRYLTKYVFKPYDGFDPPAPLFRLISKGIGENYLDHIQKDQFIKQKSWKTPDGVLPRYYRDKLFPTLSGAHVWNRNIRNDISSEAMGIVWNKILQDERQFNSLDEYIKNQNYLLRCQKRLVERKQKEKYG